MRSLIIIFLFLSMGLAGQVQYVHHSGEAILDVNLISVEQVKRHRIQRILASFSYKYDKDVIHQTNREVIHVFDSSGLATETCELNHFRKRLDSAIDHYYYMKNCYLTTHVHTDAQGSMVYTFEDMSDHFRFSAYLVPLKLEWNENLSRDFLLWSDSVINEGSDKYVSYNEFGKPYKYLVERHNKFGQLTGIDLYQQGGRLICAYDYDIDSGDIIQSIEARPNNSMMFGWRKEFTYDTDNRLSEVRYFKEGKLESFRRISYSEDGLPEIDITRNELTTKMDIVRYEYIHW